MKDQNEKSGRKGNRGGKPHYSNKHEDRVIVNGSNDVHWYGSDDAIKLAGNLSYFKALGSPITNQFINVADPGTSRSDTVPGIMAIHIMDALPKTSANPSVDAINVAARQQYALIRKANSGAKNYEWNDLIIYEMARSSLNQLYAFLGRAYGVASTYNMQNRYLPAKLLAMMGFNPDDFISNLASIRLFINNLGRRINTLALPHSLTYFERKAWLYSNIYTDAKSAKAQIVFLTPAQIDGDEAAFLYYNPTVMSTGGALVRTSLFSSGSNFEDWSVVASSFVDAMLSDDDCAIISGDILKAYGDANLFKCNPIPEDYVVVPICDYEVLSQFENLTTAVANEGSSGSSDTLEAFLDYGHIAQDGSGNLLFNPAFVGTNASVSYDELDAKFNARSPIINFHHTDVSPADTMVGTRLTTTFSAPAQVTGGTHYYQRVQYCGTEIVTKVQLAVLPTVSSSTLAIRSTMKLNAIPDFTGMFALTAFDWAPKVLYVSFVGGATNHWLPMGDYETYRCLEPSELQKLHETATLSLFGVPLIDNYTGK